MSGASDTVISNAQTEPSVIATPQYLSISEVAGLLGVNRVTIWRWIRAGRLPIRRFGHRTIRIMRDDLERLEIERASTDVSAAWLVRRHNVASPPAAGAATTQPSEHVVQFYESDDVLECAVAEFLGDGIRAGGSAIVVATTAHRLGLEQRMEAAGLAISAAAAIERYIALDAGETLASFMQNGAPHAARFGEVIGGLVDQALKNGRPVRVFGEMVALLALDGNHAAALRLEGLWNELQRARPFSLLCAYPIQRLSGDAGTALVRDVCTVHNGVVPAESYSAVSDPDERARAIAVLQQKASVLEAEIAERKRAEQELRSREAELRDFLDQGVVGLHWVDGDGWIVWANQAELDLLGYTTDEYIGHHIAEFHVDADVISDILRRLNNRETLRGYEARLRCKDGTLKHVLTSSNVLWDGEAFVHTRCFTVDITARKLAEQRLAIQYAVTRTLSEATTLAEAASSILRCVCDSLGWAVGAVWSVQSGRDVLRCDEFWSASGMEIADFEAMTRQLQLGRGGGLPGRVLARGRPVWVADVLRDSNFPRLPKAATAGLHGAFAFPIRLGDDVLGVIEFFSRGIAQPDADLLEMMAGVGGQIGQFMERTRAERERGELLVRERAARAEAELERQHMRELFTQAPAAIALLCGPEHVFEFANPLYLRMVGRNDPAVLLNHTVREALPELEPQGYFDLLDQVYQSGEPYVGQELKVLLDRLDDGQLDEAFLNVALRPIRDASGNVEGILAHAVDVTEQVRSRQRVEVLARELQAERERLSIAQAAAHIGSFEWHVQSGNASWTAELEALYGLPPEGLGGGFDRWIEHVHPDDRAGVERSVRAALDGSNELNAEFRVIWPDRSVHILATQARVIRNDQGQAERLLGVNVDITERKRSQDRLRFLAEASEALADSLDPQATLAKVARVAVPTLADWCAVDLVEDDAGGQPQRVAVAHVDPSKVALAEELQRRYPQDWRAVEGLAAAFRTSISQVYAVVLDSQLKAAARDPEHLRMLRQLGMTSVMIVPVVARDRTLGTISFVSAESGRRFGAQDVALAEELARRAGLAIDNACLYRGLQEQTDTHVQLNASLREVADARDRALDELRQLMEARDEFLSSVAHDLKNPLANMKAQAQLMQRRAGRGMLEHRQIEEGLTSIDASATRMAGLVNELLDTARIQLGKPLELTRRRMDLVELVVRATAEHQQATERHRIELQTEVSELRGQWDDERLARVLGNILGNALKYSPAGGTVHVSVAAEDGSTGRSAVVKVRDTGIGIPADDLPRVFDRFHRGANVVGRIAGTGIGLAGARSIVEGHGGTISVQSQEGVGSTFSVRLPLDPEEADATDSRH